MQPMKDDFGYLLSQTSRYLRVLLADELRNHGLDDSTYIVLYFTQRAGEGGITTHIMADTIQLPPQVIRDAARRLVRDGWLTEEADPADRESRLIQLTPKAETVVPLLVDAAHWAIERGLNGFTDVEVAQFTEFLTRMQTNLR